MRTRHRRAPKLPKAAHCHAPLKPPHHTTTAAPLAPPISLHSINLQWPIHYVLPLHLRLAQYVPSPPLREARNQEPGTKLTCVFLSPLTAFQSRLKGAEHLTVQCQNCGNLSGHVYKRWQWFTFCFVPVIPLSVKPWHVSSCPLLSSPLLSHNPAFASPAIPSSS